MIRDWGLALAITVGVLVAWNYLQPGPMSQGSAPAFTLPDTDGGTKSFVDAEGVTVLNFWATWCGPCKMEIPELSAFHESHPSVTLWGISGDERLSLEALGKASDRLGITYDVLHDRAGSVFQQYGVSSLPTTVVIKANGEIAGMHVGMINQKQLDGLVHAAGG